MLRGPNCDALDGLYFYGRQGCADHSICESCYSTRFYLEGKDLVCMACGTRWRNTDLFGIGGGCVKYPPEELKYEVQGDYVVVPETKLAQWQPRYLLICY